jgi:hypothetical protein
LQNHTGQPSLQYNIILILPILPVQAKKAVLVARMNWNQNQNPREDLNYPKLEPHWMVTMDMTMDQAQQHLAYFLQACLLQACLLQLLMESRINLSYCNVTA